MRYLVIEHFTHGPGPVHERASPRGRSLPEGLSYVDSWVVDDGRLDTCYQLMETDDPSLFDVWFASWSDLVVFEVVPVISTGVAADRCAPVDRSRGGGPQVDR